MQKFIAIKISLFNVSGEWLADGDSWRLCVGGWGREKGGMVVDAVDSGGRWRVWQDLAMVVGQIFYIGKKNLCYCHHQNAKPKSETLTKMLKGKVLVGSKT